MIAVSAVRGAAALSAKLTPLSPGPRSDFKQVLDSVRQLTRESGGADMFADLQRMQASLLNGRTMPLQDLLLYQVKAGQFGLRVELLSKMADSLLQTVKRLQNTQ